MNNVSRRSVLLAGAGLGWSASWAQTRAETRILCGYPAGGSVDLVSRKTAEKFAAHFGAPAFVDNRTGAAGRLAVTQVVKASEKTLLVTPASVLTMYPHVYADLGYDPLTELAPVCTVAATAFVIAVGPKVPAQVRDLPGFVQWCKDNRGLSQCGNAGAGSMPHFMAMLFAGEAGVAMDHIPFRGGSAAMQAVAAGDLAAALGTESSALNMVEAGRLRVLAVSSGERSPFFAGAPTFQELGFPKLTQREWFGVFAPARADAKFVDRAAAAISTGFDEPDARELLRKSALLPDRLKLDALHDALQSEYAFWGPLIRNSGFKPET